MKVIVLVLLIGLVMCYHNPEPSNDPDFAEDFYRCPNNQWHPWSYCARQRCQKKVCAVDCNNIILKTYRNECQACGYDGVHGYYHGECPSRNTYLCQFPSPSSCSNKNQPVCALKDDLTLKTYINKCKACKERGVKSYQFGTCEYPGV